MVTVFYNSGWCDITILICDDEYKIVNSKLEVLGTVPDLNDLEGLEKEFKSVLLNHLSHSYLIRLRLTAEKRFNKFIRKQIKERDAL